MVGVILIPTDIIARMDITLGMMTGVIMDMEITIPIIGDTIIILIMVTDGAVIIIPQQIIKKDHLRKEAVLSEIHREAQLVGVQAKQPLLLRNLLDWLEERVKPRKIMRFLLSEMQ